MGDMERAQRIRVCRGEFPGQLGPKMRVLAHNAAQQGGDQRHARHLPVMGSVGGTGYEAGGMGLEVESRCLP